MLVEGRKHWSVLFKNQVNAKKVPKRLTTNRHMAVAMSIRERRSINVGMPNDRNVVETLLSARTAILPQLAAKRNFVLRRLPIIVLQQSTKPRRASDLRHRKDLGRIRFASPLRRLDQFVFQTLVRSTGEAIVHRLADDVVQVFFAEDKKVVQDLALQRLNYSFDVGYNVWGTDRRLLDLCTRVREFGVETRSELAVPIMHHDFNTQLGPLREPEHRVGLVLDPGIVRIERPGRDVDSSRSDTFSRRIFRMVLRQITPTPNFFSSPKIRVKPQPFSRAIFRTSRRRSNRVLGRPFFPRRTDDPRLSRIHRRSVFG
jgi:hypothetical protein